MGLVTKQVEMSKMEELEKIQNEMLRLSRRMGEILFSVEETSLEESSNSQLSPTRPMRFKASLLQEDSAKEEEPLVLPKPSPKSSPKRVKAEPSKEESSASPKPAPKPSPKRVKAEPSKEESSASPKPTMKPVGFDVDTIFPENTTNKCQSIGRFIAKKLAGEEICGWRIYTGQNKGMICCLPGTKNDAGLYRCSEHGKRNMKCSGDSILQELLNDHSDEKLSDHFSSDEEIQVMKTLLASGESTTEKKI